MITEAYFWFRRPEHAVRGCLDGLASGLLIFSDNSHDCYWISELSEIIEASRVFLPDLLSDTLCASHASTKKEGPKGGLSDDTGEAAAGALGGLR